MMTKEQVADKLTKSKIGGKIAGMLVHIVADATDWRSTTRLTEVIGGSSGRGNQNIAKQVYGLYHNGFLENTVRGKNQYFKPTEAVVEWAKEHPDYASIKKFFDEEKTDA